MVCGVFYRSGHDNFNVFFLLLLQLQYFNSNINTYINYIITTKVLRYSYINTYTQVGIK